MRAYDIIKKKRDGGAVSKEELSFLIDGLLKGEIPDYQASAFLMAVFLNGMTDEETVSLTEVMLRSGATLDLSDIQGTKVDKHSTGGVGDKVSIILAPLMATMGIKVPMLAGRGLGHTGGTLDKLESIPGFRTDIPLDEFRENLKNIGISIMGQTGEIAPADGKLYGLRDVTATVESIPLIASSIMSKKLAEGANALLLDVKTGSGAFMKSREDAVRLATTMVRIGNSMGVNTVAVVTDMDQPLGKTVGNSLEIKECVSALRGRAANDLMEVTLTLAAWMLNLADSVTEDTEVGKMNEFVLKKYKHEAMDFIEKGDAFKKFVELIDAQHGDPDVAFRPNLLPVAKGIKDVSAAEDGYIRRLDAEAVGAASMLLGAGRMKAGDEIDHAAGIILNKKTGDYVKAGETVAILHYNNDCSLKDAEEVFRSGLEIGAREVAKRPLIMDVIIK
ncbi:MAG: thymidine phosphorylase [Thermodesulfovibrionales bacterium]|nr:thymidine phosphorylase [Thermodesulfovibrionales bacterium]